MDATQFPDFADSIRYALSHRPRADDRIDIVLDLYRGAVPALTRTIARVTDAQVGPVTLKCRSYLERRGAHAVGNVSLGAPHRWTRDEAPDPWRTAPVAAFDWMFAG